MGYQPMDYNASASHESQIPRSVLLLCFGGFAALGTLFFFFLTVMPLTTYLSAKHWLETPCTIISSKVETHRSSSADRRDSTTYKVGIRYAYMVDGKRYENTRYDLMNIATDGKEEKLAIVKKYPARKETSCYVNPDNPKEAVIDRDASLKMLWGLFPLPFMLIGYVGIFSMVFRRSDDSGSDSNEAARS